MSHGCIECLLLTAIVGAAGWASSDGERGSYDHFVGNYAFEATPHWVEFEVTRAGAVFSVLMPGGEKFVDLKVSDGALVGKDPEGRDVWLRRDSGSERYTLVRRVRASERWLDRVRSLRFAAASIRTTCSAGRRNSCS